MDSIKPIAYLFQHEETGRTQCIEAQQVEWGFEKNNPRWRNCGPLYAAPYGPLVGLIAAAAKRAQCRVDEIELCSWPHVFGSTAGPGGGAGGQMIISFQVYAFDAGERTKWCSGWWKQWDGEMRGEW